MQKLMITLALAFALLSSIVAAQGLEPSNAVVNAYYDLDATSFTYCRYEGLNGSVDPTKGKPGGANITTSGLSSTTITGTGAFTNVIVGDVIHFTGTGSTVFTQLGVNSYRVVSARASADSITVFNAVTIPSTGVRFEYLRRVCGTADTSGLIPVDGLHSHTWEIGIQQINTTSGIDYELECRVRGPGATWVIVSGPTTKTAVGNYAVVVSEAWNECRMGLKMTSTDDGSDVGAAMEQITINMTGRR